MKYKKYALCLSSLLLLSACASSGNNSIENETTQSINTKVVDGTTTKDQIKAFFGDPLETSFTDSGHEVWTYRFTKSYADGTNFIPYYGALSHGTHGKAKSLIIIFDGDKVWHHTLSNSAVKTHAGF